MGGAALFNLVRRAIGSPRILFAAALLVRLIVAWEIVPQLRSTPYFERNETTRVASAIVSGNGFSSPWPDTPMAPTAVLPPLYPFLVAAIFKFAGACTDLSIWLAVSLNALFSAMTGVAILQVGAHTFGRGVGIVAAWAWAMSPYEAVVSARIWESCLSALLLMLMVWFASGWSNHQSLRSWLLFGVLGGISTLNNPVLMTVFISLLLWFWIQSCGASRTVPAILCLLVCLAILLPWTVRNYSRFHRLIPVRDGFGLELWIGNHVNGPQDTAEFQRLGEIAFMEKKRAEALAFIAQKPWEFARRSGQRFVRFWTNPDAFVWLPVSVLAWVGAGLVLARRHLAAIPCVIAIVFFPLVHYVTHPGITYRHPIEPVIALLATYTVFVFAEKIRGIAGLPKPSGS